MLEEELSEVLPNFPLPMVAQRLFNSRTLVIVGEINNRLAEQVTSQLLALASESNEPIPIQGFLGESNHAEGYRDSWGAGHAVA